MKTKKQYVLPTWEALVKGLIATILTSFWVAMQMFMLIFSIKAMAEIPYYFGFDSYTRVMIVLVFALITLSLTEKIFYQYKIVFEMFIEEV